MRCVMSLSIIAVMLLGFTLSSCGGKEEPKGTQEVVQQMNSIEDQARQAAEGMEKWANRKPVPPVNFRLLVEILPKAVPGLKAESPNGETASMGEFAYATASQKFANDAGTMSADVEIFDYAFIPAFYMGYQFLLNLNYSKESMEGYEKSMKFNEYPAFIRWVKEGASAEFTVLVSDRFIVQIRTNGMGENAAQEIASSMDLKKLATLQ